MFDCVLPTRVARNGTAFTRKGSISTHGLPSNQVNGVLAKFTYTSASDFNLLATSIDPRAFDLKSTYDITTDSSGLHDTYVLHATCARLMTMASGSGSGAAELVPELAVKPPAVSAGGRVYTFRIRPGYRFSPPSGEPVTAVAFQRAIERGAVVTPSPLEADGWVA